jgi:hypothetical protein
MDNQKIIDNMPEGATHVLGGNCYCNEYVREDHESDGYGYLTYVNNETTTEGHRSLADIKHIAELEKEVVKANMKLIDCALDIAELEKGRDDAVIAYNNCMTGSQIHIRDIEQQAKGINDFGKWVLDTDKNASELDVRDIDLIEFYIEHLRNQSKALKEQGNG